MRHRRHKSHLGRTWEHRAALIRNLSIAFIRSERGIIHTTEAKAKQLRPFIEKLITIAKAGIAANDDKGVTLAKRRLAFSYLQHKESVKKLFSDLAVRFANREGGYTRIVKAGRRAGDGAPMAFIEFVERPPDTDSRAAKAEKKAKSGTAAA
jgi:large subunit ribosomal protein L17